MYLSYYCCPIPSPTLCPRCDIQDCESLIEIGADVNWTSADGDACIHAACRRGHADTVSILLRNGANVNAVGKDGLTPLHICAKRGDADCVSALLMEARDTGLDVTLKTPDGATAMDFARSSKVKSIVDRLANAGAREGSGVVKSNEFRTAMSSPTSGKAEAKESGAGKGVSRRGIAEGKASAAGGDSKSDSPKRSYQLMGNDRGVSSGGSDSAVVNDAGSMAALRKILETEQRERRSAESSVDMMRAQIDMMRDMMEELKGEIMAMQNKVVDARADKEALTAQLEFIRGGDLETAGRDHCDRLEKQTRDVLARIQERRVVIEREEESRGKPDERRLCVVCVETEKSIVLLPCRHMCLCEACSEHKAMTQCPLCRRQIINKFSVFA